MKYLCFDLVLNPLHNNQDNNHELGIMNFYKHNLFEYLYMHMYLIRLRYVNVYAFGTSTDVTM